MGILGETGSGKTNLVYGILRHFNIITDNVEDEYFTSLNLKYLNLMEKKSKNLDINAKNPNKEEDSQSIELSNASFSSDEQEKKNEKKD